jgi:hypothetical protein
LLEFSALGMATEANPESVIFLVFTKLTIRESIVSAHQGMPFNAIFYGVHKKSATKLQKIIELRTYLSVFFPF